MHNLLCLIHVVHRHLWNDFTVKVKMMPILRANTDTPVEFAKTEEVAVAPDFMLVYKKMKFKMKLAYESYMNNVRVGRLLNIAIYKTIVQRQEIAANNLSNFLTKEYSL